jgi:hypothetical protein
LNLIMKSWLRKVAKVLLSRPDPRQSMPDVWRPEDFTPIAETAAAPDPWADTTSHPPESSGPQPPLPAYTTPRSVQPIEARRDYGPATPVDPTARILEQPDLGASTETLRPSSPAGAEVPRRFAAAAPDPASEGLPPASLPNPSTEADSQPADTAAEQPPVLVPTPAREEAEAARPITASAGDWGEHDFATATWPAPDAEQQHDPGADAGIQPAYAEPDAFDTFPFSVDLPDYDPTLNQRLGSEEWAIFDPSGGEAKQKAAIIATLLDVTTRRELNAAAAWLYELFVEHPRPATFSALERAALEGLDFATLRDMAALRALWAQHPEWWVCRILSRHARNGATSVSRLPNGATALSWALARRICLARADYPVEQMIDPDWLGEWYRLRPQPGTPVSFVTFIEDKIANETARQIHAGLDGLHRAGDLVERWDRHDWPQDLCDPSDGTPLSLSMVDIIGPRAKSEPDAE